MNINYIYSVQNKEERKHKIKCVHSICLKRVWAYCTKKERERVFMQKYEVLFMFFVGK